MQHVSSCSFRKTTGQKFELVQSKQARSNLLFLRRLAKLKVSIIKYHPRHFLVAVAHSGFNQPSSSRVYFLRCKFPIVRDEQLFHGRQNRELVRENVQFFRKFGQAVSRQER